MTRLTLLKQLYQAINTGVECVDRLNSGRLDLVERVEARAQMAVAWAKMQRMKNDRIRSHSKESVFLALRERVG